MPASVAPLPVADRVPEIAFSGSGAYRKTLENGGRAHVDRPLPFLILNRFSKDRPDSLAKHVTATGSAYVIWTERDCDQEARASIDAITRKLCEEYERLLLVSLYDLPRDENLDEQAPRLESFIFRISASDDPAAQAAADCLEQALAAIEVDLRKPDIESISKAYFEPGIEELAGERTGISHISLGVPQNYRVPGEESIYPQLLHELTIAIFDALLRAFHAFFGAISPNPPAHHRALGRSSFIAAARTVDRKLDGISSAFDFFLSVSPINSAQAFEQFKAVKYEKAPAFRYRPLTIDPELAKRRLYAIDLRRVEDPVLESLFAEKRRELDQQLTMLHSRNAPAFRYSSLMLYGPVERSLLDAATDILARVEPGAGAASDSEMIDASVVRDAARRLVRAYREIDDDFVAQVSLREDIAAGLMVSGRKLLISTATRMRRGRLDGLLQHEVSIHLLTYINGNGQGLKIFRSGLAGYEGIQEGLGVFAECAVGALTPVRLRLLAARVVAVEAMIEGADFIEVFRLLREEHGFGARGAFNIAERVHRSGGLSKDAIYLRGFKTVLDMLARGQELRPFWFGKIAASHVPVVEELELRGLLRPPRVTPEFLERDDARERIAFMRTNPSLFELI